MVVSYLSPRDEKNSDMKETGLPISKSSGKELESQKLRDVISISCSYYKEVMEMSFKPT